MNLVNQHIPEDDLALFALALMPPEEAAYTQAHLKHCDECRGEVARMQGDLVTYAFSADMHDAPAEARSRFLDAVSREKKMHTAVAAQPVLAPRSSDVPERETRRERPARSGPGVVSWAGWAIAAGVTAFAGWQFHQQQGLRDQLATQTAATEQINAEAAKSRRVFQALTDPTAMQVALHLPATGTAPPKPEGHASYNASNGELVFVATHLQSLKPEKTYELWLLPAAASEAPVPAGTFKPDVNGNASVVLPELPRNIAAKGFGVTVEADGGSKTPTLPIVLAGT